MGLQTRARKAVSGPRIGQAGQNLRLQVTKLVAKRPTRMGLGGVRVTGLGALYPHAGLGEVGPHGDLFARTHVRVAVPLEGRLQLLQLLAGEVRSLPPLLLLQRAVFRGSSRQRSRGLLRVWGPHGGRSGGFPSWDCSSTRRSFTLGPHSLLGIELLSPPRPEGSALTAVFLALAAVFWEWGVGSARI